MFVFFLIIGLLGFLYGIYYLSSLNELQKNGIEIDGIIISYESTGEGYQTPVIYFKTLNGEEIQKKPYFHSSSDLNKFIVYDNNINKKVTVIYNPKKPKIFAIKNDVMNYLGIFFLIIVSFVFLVVGVFNFINF